MEFFLLLSFSLNLLFVLLPLDFLLSFTTRASTLELFVFLERPLNFFFVSLPLNLFLVLLPLNRLFFLTGRARALDRLEAPLEGPQGNNPRIRFALDLFFVRLALNRLFFFAGGALALQFLLVGLPSNLPLVLNLALNFLLLVPAGSTFLGALNLPRLLFLVGFPLHLLLFLRAALRLDRRTRSGF